MKIFNQVNPWPNKVNFVDDNNVILGYDMGQSCCENADWFIAREIYKEVPDDYKSMQQEGWENWGNYNFDQSFYQAHSGGNLYEGYIVIFKLVNDFTKDVIYLHLFNQHNGYYGHGFNFCVPTRKGVL